MRTFGIEYKYCDFFLEYTNFKDDLIGYKRLCCNKKYQQQLFYCCEYTYEYMDDWEKLLP